MPEPFAAHEKALLEALRGVLCQLAEPSAVLRAIYDYARVTPNKALLPPGLAHAMGRTIAALEVLDIALDETRCELAKLGIAVERTN